MYVDGVVSVEAPGYGTRHGSLLEDADDDFPEWEAALEGKTEANDIMAAFDSLLENGRSAVHRRLMK